MVIATWILQSLLGLIFVITGSFKFFQNKEKIIASGGTWAEDFSPGIIKTIAGLELVSGISVIIPRILGQKQIVTFISATCIAAIMIGAIFTHVRRKEWTHAMINCIFLIMALFVAYSTSSMS